MAFFCAGRGRQSRLSRHGFAEYGEAMRQYFQGTLDFACGLYAVMNALACIHSLDLARARSLFQEFLGVLPAYPALWRAFLRNETDHYWLIRHSLARWCSTPPLACAAEQPFSVCLLPRPEDSLDAARLYLPEREVPRGPASPEEARGEARAVWTILRARFDSDSHKNGIFPVRHAAIFRFHRFLPGVSQPIVSHWTTACRLHDDTLYLHDASAEKEALHTIAAADCAATASSSPLIRIVPESLIFLAQAGTRQKS
jgi:hypothetical protein